MEELSDSYIASVQSFWAQRQKAQQEWMLLNTPTSQWVDPVEIAAQNPSLFQGLRSSDIEALAKQLEGPLQCYVYVDGLRIKKITV